jgi:hypothetical protein
MGNKWSSVRRNASESLDRMTARWLPSRTRGTTAAREELRTPPNATHQRGAPATEGLTTFEGPDDHDNTPGVSASTPAPASQGPPWTTLDLSAIAAPSGGLEGPGDSQDQTGDDNLLDSWIIDSIDSSGATDSGVYSAYVGSR